MRTLRLLLWLRWKLFLGATTVGNRVGGAVFTFLMLVAFSPAWLGGAIGAFGGVERYGAPAAIVAFGIAQLAWIMLGLLSGALGRAFDLDLFLRYPVRPRTVFSINVVASLLSPTPLMILPTIVGVALGAGARSGPGAMVAAAAGGALLMLVTAALLQVLLALLDEALRRESVRYIATGLMALVFVGLQFVARLAMRHLAQDLAQRVLHRELGADEALALAAGLFVRIPTIGAPAAVVAGALDGAPLRLALGIAGSLGLLALAIVPGAALMRHTVRGGESHAARPAGTVRESNGGFGLGRSFLPPVAALVLRREVLQTLRHPQRLMSVVMAPLISIVFFFTARPGHNHGIISALFVLLMLASAAGSSSLLLFAYDGPGVRSFFLLPCRARDVLLGKNLEQLMRLVIQVMLALVVLGLLARGLWTPLFVTALIAAIAVIACTLAAGTAVSIRQPVRARRRGLTGRGANSWESMAVSIGTWLAGALVGGIIWGTRRLSGPWADPAGLAVAVLALAAGIAIWWRSLDLNAALMLERRERLIEVLGRIEEE